MQRTRTDRRIVFLIILFSILALCVAVDLITKAYFKNLYLEKGKTQMIENFFYFTYTQNTGSAFSFLANKSWGQIFFKCLTVVALVVFSFIFCYAFKQNYKVFPIGMALIMSGTIGNFVDRLAFSYVRDFIGFIFGSYFFPVFNFADCCITVGAVMVAVHFVFLDKDALFKKKEAEEKDGN